LPAPDTKAWTAADHKHAFTITREASTHEGTVTNGGVPVFVVQVSWLDGSQQRNIGRNFKTFEAAVRLCSIYTCVIRRQVAYHEAGHAVVAWLLGFSGRLG
jgi:hypothetical protein